MCCNISPGTTALQGTSYMAEVSSWLRRHFAAKAVHDPAYTNLRVSGCLLLCVKGRVWKGKCEWEGAWNCHVVDKAHHDLLQHCLINST
jgi:hypothetical protein